MSVGILRLNLILAGGYWRYSEDSASWQDPVIVSRKWRECWAMTIQVRESKWPGLRKDKAKVAFI